MDIAQKNLFNRGVKFFMVKTIGDSSSNKYYANTRKFYEGVGFYSLEEIKEIWDDKNPCLIMIKSI